MKVAASADEVDRREPGAADRRCRHCGSALLRSVVDLGASPLCESYLAEEDLDRMEPFYPLHLRVCEDCLLVQLPAYVPPEEIFREYAYFSSYSDSWVEHSRVYVERVADRFGLGPSSFVLELASNDGYLLQHFVARGVPVLGVEPAENVAAAAVARNVPTVTEFFGRELARTLVEERRRADLVVANNVLAQVPDLHDFVRGIGIALAAGGVVTVEFPHLPRLIDETQFDTIYHEHFSYFSLLTASRVFESAGLTVFDVEQLPTHGGSLRLYLQHAGGPHPVSPAVAGLLRDESAGGYGSLEPYGGFRRRVETVKHDLLVFLIDAGREGRRVAGYGAPGKGNTLLNYCGVRTDLLEFTVDRNPYKQGRYLPGTRIPILAPEAIDERRPDDVLILPWNLKEEIVRQLAHARRWGARFVVPIPALEVIE